MYERERLELREAGGAVHPALWKPLADFESGQAILYPVGLLALLR
jgi:hypothetical protein